MIVNFPPKEIKEEVLSVDPAAHTSPTWRITRIIPNQVTLDYSNYAYSYQGTWVSSTESE